MQDGMSNNSSSFSLKPGEVIYMELRKINSSLGISVAVSFYSVWRSFQFLNLKTWIVILLFMIFRGESTLTYIMEESTSKAWCQEERQIKMEEYR